jgi:hypothetical protein
MILGDPLLRTHITENSQLLLIVTAHDPFYQHSLFKSQEFFRSLFSRDNKSPEIDAALAAGVKAQDFL